MQFKVKVHRGGELKLHNFAHNDQRSVWTVRKKTKKKNIINWIGPLREWSNLILNHSLMACLLIRIEE